MTLMDKAERKRRFERYKKWVAEGATDPNVQLDNHLSCAWYYEALGNIKVAKWYYEIANIWRRVLWGY